MQSSLGQNCPLSDLAKCFYKENKFTAKRQKIGKKKGKEGKKRGRERLFSDSI